MIDIMLPKAKEWLKTESIDEVLVKVWAYYKVLHKEFSWGLWYTLLTHLKEEEIE